MRPNPRLNYSFLHWISVVCRTGVSRLQFRRARTDRNAYLEEAAVEKHRLRRWLCIDRQRGGGRVDLVQQQTTTGTAVEQSGNKSRVDGFVPYY